MNFHFIHDTITMTYTTRCIDVDTVAVRLVLDQYHPLIESWKWGKNIVMYQYKFNNFFKQPRLNVLCYHIRRFTVIPGAL